VRSLGNTGVARSQSFEYGDQRDGGLAQAIRFARICRASLDISWTRAMIARVHEISGLIVHMYCRWLVGSVILCNMNATVRLDYSDLALGQQASFEALVSGSDLDQFIELFGDKNPLHSDAGFARKRGFADRVVHGAYLSGLVSRLVGVHLPGENCIVHSINLQFRSPLLVDSAVRVAGSVDQLSDSVQAAVMKVSITELAEGRTVASGKVHLGFTAPV